MRRCILILLMLRIKGAVFLLYTVLIIYSEIEIVYFYLGLSFCVLQVLNHPTRSACRNIGGHKIRDWMKKTKTIFGPWDY